MRFSTWAPLPRSAIRLITVIGFGAAAKRSGTTVASVGSPAEEVSGRVGAWWRSGGRGGSAAHVVAPAGADTGAVLRRVHEDVPGSVLVDATGLTAEQVMRKALSALGVDLSSGERDDWRSALGSWGEERLLVLVNAHRAGRTRRSYEPERLIRGTVPLLAHAKVAVLADTRPEFLPRAAPPEAVFRLSEPDGAVRAPDAPAALRALALAEPRVVPLPVWAELVAAVTGTPMAPAALAEWAREHADVLRVGALGVSFTEEAVAEALRRRVGSEEVARVNRHMVAWLLRASAEFRHPHGWAEDGAVGRYAATGLAMHAVRAGTYEELLRDGRTVAHLPQTAVMDAARSHSPVVPGNSPAADAMHLWERGVAPESQREWASWLHAMAWSRDDAAFAQSVASSGISLPWQAKWVRWRPPGGFHPRFLEGGRFSRLAEVCWRGRPALAGLQKRMVGRSPHPLVSVWDAGTGERVAGPWTGDEIPLEERSDLALPPAADGRPGRPGHPTRLVELFASSSPRRNARAFLLPCAPLAVGDVVVFGGDLGLIAVQPTDGVDPSGTFGLLEPPLSPGDAVTDLSSPVDAPPPSHRDLVPLFGESDIWESDPGDLPAGLTHQPTRDLLTGFGLPDLGEGGMALLPYGDADADLFDEVDWPDGAAAVAEGGPFFLIGRWMGGELVIDGPTGHVLRMPTRTEPDGPDEEYLTGLPAARDLESFLGMVALWVAGLRSRDLAPPGSAERRRIAHRVLAELAAVDAPGGSRPAWSYVFHDE
ncbi:SUKH-4 family immunity protein [Streptomyces sp. NPDC002564]|uniref:SUKH-4 family immunity protein n=1 Tax=Streptomyces sp. NPDC002564 TaxID=3364649 RepID=UPI003683A8B8